jgi:hypothetical protein
MNYRKAEKRLHNMKMIAPINDLQTIQIDEEWIPVKIK